jgi:hypothetical protein
MVRDAALATITVARHVVFAPLLTMRIASIGRPAIWPSVDLILRRPRYAPLKEYEH